MYASLEQRLRATKIKKVVIGVSGGLDSTQALPVAASIARASGSKLRLALVHQSPDAPLDPAAAKLFTSIELASRKSERAYLRARQARLREEGEGLRSRLSASENRIAELEGELAKTKGLLEEAGAERERVGERIESLLARFDGVGL